MENLNPTRLGLISFLRTFLSPDKIQIINLCNSYLLLLLLFSNISMLLLSWSLLWHLCNFPHWTIIWPSSEMSMYNYFKTRAGSEVAWHRITFFNSRDYSGIHVCGLKLLYNILYSTQIIVAKCGTLCSSCCTKSWRKSCYVQAM